jgi:integrase
MNTAELTPHFRLSLDASRRPVVSQGAISPILHIPPILLQPTATPRKKCIEVTCGSVVVKVYPSKWRDRKRHHTYSAHTIVYRELNDAGQPIRRREKRALKKDALDRANQVATRLANNQTLMLRFAPDDQARWLACQQSAAQIGRDPVALISEYVDVLKKRPAGVTNDELLKAWQKTHPAGIEDRHIPKIVDELLKKRILSDKHRRNISKQLERFAAKFDCPFSSLQPREVDDYLDSVSSTRNTQHAARHVGLRTRRNHRAAVVTLLTFAKQRNYVQKEFEIMDQVSNPEPPAVSVNLYTPDELARLLRCAESYKAGRKLVPLLIITALAGVRHGEMNEEKIEHLDWSDFDWEGKRIFIRDEVAKQTGRKEGDGRWVDMSENLITWLAPYRRPSGKICVLENTSNALCRLRKKAGITGPKKNALRKSFITYSLALGNLIGNVADQAGNSPGIIKKNYKAAQHTRLRELAIKWFALKPDRPDDDPLFAWAKNRNNCSAPGQARPAP